MANDAAQFTYGGSGSVYVAPVGTAMPTLTTTALNAAFIQLGYTTDDGVSITPSTDINDITSWQSFYPTDKRVTGKDLTASFSLQQLDDDAWNFAFGGTWAANSTEWKWTPPAAETIDYRALIIEVLDGVDITRVLIPKGLITDVGDLVFRKEEPATLPLTFGLVTTGVGDAWNVLSNRAEFNPAT